MSHAPGPWHVSPRSKYTVRSKDYYICKVMKSKIDPSLNVAAEADARLISAAPELLEALESFVVLYKQGQLVIESDDGNDPVVAKAVTAIAKATGE
jgi:hypothetical protein